MQSGQRRGASGRLTLIQQNDIHGQMEPHPELFRAGGGESYRQMGGLARAATVVQAIRSAAPRSAAGRQR